MRRKLTDLATALVVIVLFAVVLAAIFLGGQIADDLFGKIGLGATAATVWSYARWPVALVRRDRRLRARLRPGAQRRAAPDPLDHPGRRGRRRAVDRALARLLDLRAQLLELRRRLRRLRARRSCCCCGSTCRPTRSSSAPSSTPSSSARGAGDAGPPASSRRRGRSAPAGRSTGPRAPGSRAQPAVRDGGDRVRAGQQRRRGARSSASSVSASACS